MRINYNGALCPCSPIREIFIDFSPEFSHMYILINIYFNLETKKWGGGRSVVMGFFPYLFLFMPSV